MSGGGCGLAAKRNLVHLARSASRLYKISHLPCPARIPSGRLEMTLGVSNYINCCAICFNCAACTTPLWRHLVSPFLKIISVGTLLIL